MAQRKDWFTRFFRGGKHREQAAGTGCLSPADKPQGREAAKGGEGEEKDLGYRVPTRRAGHAAPLGCGCCGPIPGVRVIEVKGG